MHSQNYIINYKGVIIIIITWIIHQSKQSNLSLKSTVAPNWMFPTEFQHLKDLEMVTSKPKSTTSLCCLFSSILQFINTGMDFALGSSMSFRDRKNFPSNIKLRRSSGLIPFWKVGWILWNPELNYERTHKGGVISVSFWFGFGLVWVFMSAKGLRALLVESRHLSAL